MTPSEKEHFKDGTPQAVKAALATVGLPNLKIVADQGDASAMERAPG